MFGFFKKKPSKKKKGPDFSDIDSLAKAKKLVREGELEKLYLLPPQFGGSEGPDNTVYVPIGIADVKAGIDENVVTPLVKKGKVTKYNTELDYEGESVVPSAIHIIASDPGEFETTINIWGKALEDDEDD